MTDTVRYGFIVLLASAVALIAVLSNRLAERVKIPVPLLLFAGAAVAAGLVPDLDRPTDRTVERIVTVALVVILFDGGMHIGWSRFRAAAAPILSVGIVGTFLTAAGAAVLLHAAFGLDWYLALLVGTAVAPTDPAVVFSVLGRRQISGRSGTILEGESGANDPVGIALLTSLLAAGGLGAAASGHAGVEFLLQVGIGITFGVGGGRVLLWFIRRVPLPSEGLYPLRTLTSVFLLYGAASVAHGSGFLAVFAAGIIVGDGRAPYKQEIERFHAALASLAEIVAFVVLGLTVDLSVLSHTTVWLPGLVLAATVTVAIRPLLVGACLVRARLQRNERVFILFAGLKGAVPLLLGESLRAADLPNPERLYGIVVIVVTFSVLIQGGLVPAVASRLQLPIHTIEPEPWTVGIRLRDKPDGVHRFTVAAGSPADRQTIDDVAHLTGQIWVSIVVRDQQLVPVRADTELRAGDRVVVLADPTLHDSLAAAFDPAAEK